MSEQRFLWNSLDGGENVFIKERGSDKIIHIKIIEGKYEFVAFMEKVNEQQSTIIRLQEIISGLKDDKNQLHKVISKLRQEVAELKTRNAVLSSMLNQIPKNIKEVWLDE